jgi:hypothetical protein
VNEQDQLFSIPFEEFLKLRSGVSFRDLAYEVTTATDDLDLGSIVKADSVAVEKRRRLQSELTAAQKRLAEHERRILELRRIHRQTHKKLLKTEDHVQRLLDKERKRSEDAKRLKEEQEQVLKDLRKLSAEGEHELKVLQERIRLEQSRVEELERINTEQKQRLHDLVERQETLRNASLNLQGTVEGEKPATENMRGLSAGLYESETNPALPQAKSTDANLHIAVASSHATERAQVARSLLTTGESVKATCDNSTSTPRPGAVKDVATRFAELTRLSQLNSEEAFLLITKYLDDASPQVRRAALRALFETRQSGNGLLTRVLQEGSSERRHKIARAIAESRFAEDYIKEFAAEEAKKGQGAGSILFLMCKAGEWRPLLRIIEEEQKLGLRLKAISLLAASGHKDVLPVLRRIAVRASLPFEVRSAAINAFRQLDSIELAPV